MIIDYLHSLDERVHLEPLGLLLPQDWCSLLPSIAPWLWDLDLTGAFSGEKLNDWDWERFVRMLAQADAFEPGGCMQGAPDGLRNRRRIWRMLGEMRAPRGEWRTEW